MKKLFASVPMKCRTEEEIRESFAKMKRIAEAYEGEELELIDTWIAEDPPEGVLIFKWSEYQIPAADVWNAIGKRPLFGHRSGKASKTFWGCYMKGVN